MRLYLEVNVSKGYADWVILSEKKQTVWKTFSLMIPMQVIVSDILCLKLY